MFVRYFFGRFLRMALSVFAGAAEVIASRPGADESFPRAGCS